MSIDFTPDPQLYPFTSRWFDSSRGRIHDLDEGPTIVPDYLGFGLSERPALIG